MKISLAILKNESKIYNQNRIKGRWKIKRNITGSLFIVFLLIVDAYAVETRVTNDPAISRYDSLAWTGSEYGIAWEDFRDGSNQIYFARLDSLGNKIGNDVRITFSSGGAGKPNLVWNGTEYGLAWSDLRDNNAGSEIYFVRIDSLGNKIGSDVRITTAWGESYWVSMVWNGTGYGLVWEDGRNSNWEIYFARINSLGSKIGSDVRITTNTANSWNPQIIWTGADYGITWMDDRAGNWDIFFAKVNSSGIKSTGDIQVTSLPTHSMWSTIDWTGTDYGIAWTDERDGNQEIYFARLDSNGLKIGSDVRITNSAGNSRPPWMVWNGNQHSLVWCDTRDGSCELYFVGIDTAGNKIGLERHLTVFDGNHSLDPEIVWANGKYGISWQETKDGNDEIYFMVLENDMLIPTLSEWMVIVLGVMLVLLLATKIKRTFNKRHSLLIKP